MTENNKELCDTDEKAAKWLKPINREKNGRPRIEVDQPALLSEIKKVIILGPQVLPNLHQIS